MNLDELGAALEGAMPELDQDGVRLAPALFRELARGEPVSEALLAPAAQLSASRVAELLSAWPGVFRDQGGNVVGFWGLAVVDMPPHRYHLGDTRLSTWCAFNPLFITRVLRTAARVESVDALTGQPVSLTLTADGVDEAPGGMVLSFLQPDGKFDADVVTNFCHFVHFFAARQNGERWAAQHPGVFLIELAEADAVAERLCTKHRSGKRSSGDRLVLIQPLPRKRVGGLGRQ